MPAAAKLPIAEAHIIGPGLRGGDLRISGRGETEGMWASGIDLFDHYDAMAGSIAELGITAVELGPRYVVSYRFSAGPREPPEIVRQELYPYAEGGPVTYTPPGQTVFGPGGMAITSGWYQSWPQFFDYLVDQGLPETNPVIASDRQSTRDGVPSATPGGWIALAFAGLVALSVGVPPLRRRVVSVARAHR